MIAMGATRTVSTYWMARAHDAMARGLHASERESGFHILAKFLRNCLQTALLGVGAALTIAGELSSGGLIAGTILGTRALAPVEAGIGAWKSVLGARQAWTRLDAALGVLSAAVKGLVLPRPSGAITLENVALAPPGSRTAIIARLSLDLTAGEQLAILGPSGSGKSTLIRAMMGLLPCATGNIRIDGADVAMWRRQDLGQWIGYLPQASLLIEGTVAENICHFSGASSEAIIAAAQEAGAHDLILSLPNGYDTDLGETRLSGGQMQRIALAAALFGTRPIIFLDEPEANLDIDGEAQLRTTLQRLRARNATVIIVSHRPAAVALTDKLLLLRHGHAEFGPREEIMAKIMRASLVSQSRAAGE
jgi:PrtD family type I secretion system ABC transporter